MNVFDVTEVILIQALYLSLAYSHSGLFGKKQQKLSLSAGNFLPQYDAMWYTINYYQVMILHGFGPILYTVQW